MAVRLEVEHREAVAGTHLRQPALAVVVAGRRNLVLVATFLVGGQEAAERDDRAAGRELGVPAVAAGRAEPDRHGLAPRVGHLRGDGALPDQVVERQLVAAELARHLTRRTERVAGRPDGLVRLLGVLHLALVPARDVGHVLRAVDLAGLRPGGGQCRLRQRRRVGAHVGDVAVLVQPLGDPHRGLRGHPQLAAGLLLQRRGHERRGRPAAVGLVLDAADREGGVPQGVGQAAGGLLVEVHAVEARDRLAVPAEVAAGGHPAAVDRRQPGVEPVSLALRLLQRRLDVPVGHRAEGDPLPLALDDQPGGDRLHATRGQPLPDLAPEHRGDLVAVQPVQDAAGLLGVDQALVEVAGLLDGGPDRVAGDLVEDHPADGHLGVEHLQQVPRDGLALAVLVCREEQLVRVLERPLELGDLLLLVGVDDVVRLEVGVHVDRELPEAALLLARRQLGRGRQVADVSDAGLDGETGPEVARDRLRLRGRLDDHQPAGAGLRLVLHGHVSTCLRRVRRVRRVRWCGASGRLVGHRVSGGCAPRMPTAVNQMVSAGLPRPAAAPG